MTNDTVSVRISHRRQRHERDVEPGRWRSLPPVHANEGSLGSLKEEKAFSLSRSSSLSTSRVTAHEKKEFRLALYAYFHKNVHDLKNLEQNSTNGYEGARADSQEVIQLLHSLHGPHGSLPDAHGHRPEAL